MQLIIDLSDDFPINGLDEIRAALRRIGVPTLTLDEHRNLHGYQRHLDTDVKPIAINPARRLPNT